MNHRLSSVRRLAAVATFALCLAPLPAAAQAFKWWQSEKFQQDLQLTGDQIERIEETFQASLPEFREQKQTLDKLEDDLSRLIDASADEAAVMQQADRVEDVRSHLSKARTRMLVRIRRVLTPDQRVRLAALHHEWERSRKRQDRKK
jgi:Spy/CpxP family protein refolding chaperone